jgi:hypothetical protein
VIICEPSFDQTDYNEETKGTPALPADRAVQGRIVIAEIEISLMWFLALFTTVFSGILLGLSVFPGPLELLPATLANVLGASFVLLAGVAALQHLGRTPTEERRRHRISALVVLVSLVATPILLATNQPRRLMFQHYESQFESLLTDAPPAGDRSVTPLNADLALFWIDHWGTDRRGGTYFRTLVSGERGGSVRQSFGFAHKPNPEGCPFGNGHYELQHMTGDWYSFSASDE